MLKKRVIFTLLYDGGFFMLSRNFRLQRVGDLQWLQKNYNFSQIAFSIDELIVLDVSRGQRNAARFCDHLKALTEGCFVPIAAGGGVRTVEDVRTLLRSGADKVVVNTLIFENSPMIESLSQEFGCQCVVASIDATQAGDGTYRVRSANGGREAAEPLKDQLKRLSEYSVGELYLNSIDRDGTGQGYDFGLLDQLPETFSIPVILAGGAGKYHHLAEGLADPRVDAVATAHLFNFVGDGLEKARQGLFEAGFQLAKWEKPRNGNLVLSKECG